MAASAARNAQRLAAPVIHDRLQAPIGGRGCEASLTRLRPSKRSATLFGLTQEAVSKRRKVQGRASVTVALSCLPTAKAVWGRSSQGLMAVAVRGV